MSIFTYVASASLFGSTEDLKARRSKAGFFSCVASYDMASNICLALQGGALLRSRVPEEPLAPTQNRVRGSVNSICKLYLQTLGRFASLARGTTLFTSSPWHY